MTVEDVEAARRAVVNTTEAPPGLTTQDTGIRTVASHDIAYGFGSVSPQRVLTGDETSITDQRVFQGAIVGLSAGLAGAVLRRYLSKK